jgi:hypothetical protein
MSNNSHYQADRSQEVRPGNPSASSPADLAAAAALMSLSRGGSSSTRVDTSQIWDARTTTQRLEPVTSNATGGVNHANLMLANPSYSAAATSDQVSQLAERLMVISLVHSNPLRVEPLSEPSTFVTPGVQPTIQYYRSSEVPGEVGRFVDVWDARACTPYTILNMLFLNNVIVPPEYVFRRVGLCMWRQIPICGARIVLSAPQVSTWEKKRKRKRTPMRQTVKAGRVRLNFGMTSTKECLLLHGREENAIGDPVVWLERRFTDDQLCNVNG